MRTSASEYMEKLKQIQDGTITKLTQIPSDEPRFIIDSDSRKITIPDEFTFLAVKNDANAETIYFEIDRYFDAEDLSKHTIVVQYADTSEIQSNSPIGVDVITDIDITSVPGKIIFGWTISHEVTFKSAEVAFAVRFYSIGDNNKFSYSFNTLSKALPVLNTLDVTSSSLNRYANILDKWLEDMEAMRTEINNYITIVKDMSMKASFDATTGNLTIKTV